MKIFQLSALAIAGLCAAYSAAAEPLVISRGGSYTGDFASRDPKVPAISIATSEPVVVEHARVSGPGNLIASAAAHVNVRITDVRGSSTPAADRAAGRFVAIESFDRVTIENCELSGTAGIYLLDYGGGTTADNGVVIQRNRATNIDGRHADGRGEFLAKADLVQFAQLDKVRRAPKVEIAWNCVTDEPGKSCVEDVVSIYLSSGTADRPIDIHDNFIRGAYPADPASADYSGGGIMLGDGVAKEADGDPAFVNAHDNVVLDTVNYGIAISAGHDLTFFNNRILSAGKFEDGTAIAAQNTGAYVWDSYHAGHARFYNNDGHGNLVGWATAKGGRNDWWRPDATAWAGNKNWPAPLTRASYDAELAQWEARAKGAGVVVGVRD